MKNDDELREGFELARRQAVQLCLDVAHRYRSLAMYPGSVVTSSHWETAEQCAAEIRLMDRPAKN